MSMQSPFGEWRQRAPRRPDSDYEYVLDGDQHCLEVGWQISNIHSFRSRLSRMCQERGLRHRTTVHEGKLYVEVFRVRPGDLFEETYPEASDESLGPSPAQ